MYIYPRFALSCRLLRHDMTLSMCSRAASLLAACGVRGMQQRNGDRASRDGPGTLPYRRVALQAAAAYTEPGAYFQASDFAFHIVGSTCLSRCN